MSQAVDICLGRCTLKMSRFENFLIQDFILEYATNVKCIFLEMSILNDQVILASETDDLELSYTKC